MNKAYIHQYLFQHKTFVLCNIPCIFTESTDETGFLFFASVVVTVTSALDIMDKS